MPTIEYWIQIENHPWDACPNNIDRMTGEKINPASLPAAGGTSNPMAKPLDNDALILRRYTANWAAPDDRKVNPWDLNEPDPALTKGTIPGPAIECDLATRDDVIVHFRNMDLRRDANGQLLAVERRAHSLHPHGFAFAPQFDGAYPLSPQDTNQPIPAAEVPAWSSLSVTGFKQGDRVPAPTPAAGDPAGTFDYHWQTIGWQTTAGVWHYHDHSICDVDNINYGAIGIIVIHNSNDPEDFLTQDLPGGSPNGSPIQVICFPPPFPIPIPPHVVELLGRRLSDFEGGGTTGMPAMPGMPAEDEDVISHLARQRKAAEPADEEKAAEPSEEEMAHLVDLEHLLLDVDVKELVLKRYCIRRYRTPKQALYLQLYHTLGDAGVCINGRTFLGNTPTLVAGENTHMRFGVVGMGSEFHTFHIHGHRWILPGPHGTDLATIQSSPQDQAVTQFEDTRLFGPANSFVFTIHEGDGFMRPPPGLAAGEWHMHCHVLSHMMMGMMGSLLVVRPGTQVVQLPRGKPCPPLGMAPPPGTVQVKMAGTQFNPKILAIPRGTIVEFINDDTTQHSATADDLVTFDSSPACSFGNLAACLPPNNAPGSKFTWTSPTTGPFPLTIGYHCRLHGAAGAGMFGTITVT